MKPEQNASSSDINKTTMEDSSSWSDVVLNVYDLTSANDYSYWFGLGIFHSGIQVHGMEYGFGAHAFPVSGVFEVEPMNCPGFTYRCAIPLGRITMPPSDFRTFIENMAAEYHGDTYHLISKNCNHFTNDVSLRLTGKPIPGWVNRLALLGSICSCLLPETLQATTVKELPEYHGCSEEDDESETFSTTTTNTTREATESGEADQERHLLSPSNGEVTFIKEIQK